MQCPSCQTPCDDSQRFCPKCGTVLGAADPQTPDPLVGQTLGGKYKVVRLLGEGGMGCVYEGSQQLGTTARKVAVKTLHPHLSRDPKVKARFEREVATIAELEHPNTIQVYDFGSTPEGILYLVMEFLQGRSLCDVLEKDGAMQPDRAQHVLEQACGSLEEAHKRGIVHRDLKPDNIVLVERAGKKDFVKVLDFGIAKRANEEDKNEQKLTQQGMVLGTPPYMSPEQFTGRPIDARSDIYSLGIVAYEMLTGKLPFEAQTAWEWATQHMTQPPIPIESLAEGTRAPEAMRSAIKRALAKSPDERFATVSEFYDAFAGKTSAQTAPAYGTAPMAVAAAAATAPAATPAQRQKTEVGAPLDIAAAFGGGGPAPMQPPGPMQATPPAMAPQQQPPAVAFTPQGIPQAPQRQASGGGPRMALLSVAGLVGVGSVAAIVFALRGGGSSHHDADLFGDAGQPPAPATSIAPTNAMPSPAPDDSSLPPLTGANHWQPTPHQGPGPGPTHSAQPPPPGPKKCDAQCQTACANYKHMMQTGRAKEAESWKLACIAGGGAP